MVRTASIAVALTFIAVGAACEAHPATPLPGPLPSSSSSSPAVVLAPKAYRIAPMPVTPTWQPGGERAQPSFAGEQWQLKYVTASLTLEVSYASPDSGDVRPQGKGSPVTVLGVPGKLYHGVIGDSPAHTLIVVTDDRGLTVKVYGYQEAVVRQFAKGLRWQPMPVNAPFEVALLPERFVPVRISSYMMEFVADPESQGYVAIALRGDLEHDPRAVPTNVNGHRAEMFISADQAWIWVFLDDNRTLQIDVDPSLRFDRAALERLAGGVRVTDFATVWSNI
jgi:hypothetical protein